jgi:hypothetical protein
LPQQETKEKHKQTETMIAVNINVTRIDKTALYQGKNGEYLALVLHENKAGQDQYGNAGFVTQDIGKERRLAGERGPILGNYKHIGGLIGDKPAQHEQAKEYQPHLDADGEEIPF